MDDEPTKGVATMPERIITKIIGEPAAIRLGLYKPRYVSSRNKVVFGYVESMDGAFRERGFVVGENGGSSKPGVDSKIKP
jgi:hypothetical protein